MTVLGMIELRLNARIAALIALLLWPVGADAENYYVSASGNDGNACLSIESACKTGQAAVGKMAPGIHNLTFAPGIFAETVDVSHGRQVSIQGPRESDGSCPNPSLVTIGSVVVQDNATAWVGCLTVEAVLCRQYSIVDVANAVFVGSGQVSLHAKETCRINTAQRVWVEANIVALAIADDYSSVHIGG